MMCKHFKANTFKKQDTSKFDPTVSNKGHVYHCAALPLHLTTLIVVVLKVKCFLPGYGISFIQQFRVHIDLFFPFQNIYIQYSGAFLLWKQAVLLLEYIQNVSSSYLVCRLEALSCCMTQFWRRCWTFHSRVFWYTDELMVESKYPHSCGWKTRQNHHPSTIILTSWYVFVLLRSPHTVLCIMATHSQMSFCHFFPWQPFQTTYTCSVFFPIVLS